MSSKDLSKIYVMNGGLSHTKVKYRKNIKFILGRKSALETTVTCMFIAVISFYNRGLIAFILTFLSVNVFSILFYFLKPYLLNISLKLKIHANFNTGFKIFNVKPCDSEVGEFYRNDRAVTLTLFGGGVDETESIINDGLILDKNSCCEFAKKMLEGILNCISNCESDEVKFTLLGWDIYAQVLVDRNLQDCRLVISSLASGNLKEAGLVRIKDLSYGGKGIKLLSMKKVFKHCHQPGNNQLKHINRVCIQPKTVFDLFKLSNLMEYWSLDLNNMKDVFIDTGLGICHKTRVEYLHQRIFDSMKFQKSFNKIVAESNFESELELLFEMLKLFRYKDDYLKGLELIIREYLSEFSSFRYEVYSLLYRLQSQTTKLPNSRWKYFCAAVSYLNIRMSMSPIRRTDKRFNPSFIKKLDEFLDGKTKEMFTTKEESEISIENMKQKKKIYPVIDLIKKSMPKDHHIDVKSVLRDIPERSKSSFSSKKKDLYQGHLSYRDMLASNIDSELMKLKLSPGDCTKSEKIKVTLYVIEESKSKSKEECISMINEDIEKAKNKLRGAKLASEKAEGIKEMNYQRGQLQIAMNNHERLHGGGRRSFHTSEYYVKNHLSVIDTQNHYECLRDLDGTEDDYQGCDVFLNEQYKVLLQKSKDLLRRPKKQTMTGLRFFYRNRKEGLCCSFMLENYRKVIDAIRPKDFLMNIQEYKNNVDKCFSFNINDHIELKNRLLKVAFDCKQKIRLKGVFSLCTKYIRDLLIKLVNST